jgi:pimeloyl-ACP methyl ester carboxylesterase
MHAPVRRIGELLRLALPNAAFCTIPGMGHMGPITHSIVVARRIAGFVRECAFRPESGARGLAA